MAIPRTTQAREFAVDAFERIKRLLLTPSAEFSRLATEPQSLKELTLQWIVPLSALMVLGNTFRAVTFGIAMQDGEPFYLYVGELPYLMLPLWIQSMVMPFVSGSAIMLVGRYFGATSDYRQATRTAAYASTPGWLLNTFGAGWALHADDFTFNPPADVLLFAGAAWGIYLLWHALPAMMKVPPSKALYATGVIALVVTLLWSLAFLATHGIIAGLMQSSVETFD